MSNPISYGVTGSGGDVIGVRPVTATNPLPVSLSATPTIDIGDVTVLNPSEIWPDGVADGVTKSASVTSATTILTFSAAELKGMGYIAFGFTSVGSSNTILVEGASDGDNFNASSPFWIISTASAVSVLSLASPATTNIMVAPVTAPSMRIRVSVYGSGTVTATAMPKRGPVPPSNTLQVGGNSSTGVVGSAASGASDSGNPVKVGLRYNSTAVAVSNGQRVDAQAAGPNGALLVEEGGRSFGNITTTTTTTLKSGAGYLHSLTINTPVATSIITIYDNTAGSGTKIGTITLPATLLSDGPKTAIFNVAFATGLTIVTGTAASDITVSYR